MLSQYTGCTLPHNRVYDGCVLNTQETANLAKTTTATVKREIGRGNLEAEKVGGVWVIELAEAKRWAASFKPYAALYKPR